jgi:hypothetical protein
MKNNKFLRVIGLVAVFAFMSISMNAQSTADVAKLGTAVRLVDNKGTVKFLQANNGITQIVNTTADRTTTTWQLGGSLTNNTYIDVTGHVFGLDKIDLISTAASTDATDKSVHGTGTGWTLLVRDEATGAIQKMLASDLLTSGETTDTASADATSLAITATGIKASTLKSRIWVYRNGAKLLPSDFTVANDVVTVNEVTGTGNDAWTILSGDVFEVQWLK